MNNKIRLIFAVLVLIGSSFILQGPRKPVVYIIGDSTVRNKMTNGLWGWGSLLSDYMDTSRILMDNQAIAGRSARTFYKEGRWKKVVSCLHQGDYVLIQFGHNDEGIPDTSHAGYRADLKGIGDDSLILDWGGGKREVVHSYGWYLRHFVVDAQSKGATPIIVSMIPRNIWKHEHVLRASDGLGKLARQVALDCHVPFLDLNQLIADDYDKIGPDLVSKFFPGDHTHTNLEGARFNAKHVAQGISRLDCSLKKIFKIK